MHGMPPIQATASVYQYDFPLIPPRLQHAAHHLLSLFHHASLHDEHPSVTGHGHPATTGTALQPRPGRLQDEVHTALRARTAGLFACLVQSLSLLFEPLASSSKLFLIYRTLPTFLSKHDRVAGTRLIGAVEQPAREAAQACKVQHPQRRYLHCRTAKGTSAAQQCRLCALLSLGACLRQVDPAGRALYANDGHPEPRQVRNLLDRQALLVFDGHRVALHRHPS